MIIDNINNMDEEELIEFCLPSNEQIEPFFHLVNEKKIKK